MSELHIKPVESLDDAMAIAEVRNSGRHFMTHNQKLLVQSLQEKWYNETYVPRNQAGDMFAFTAYDETTPVAYGLANRPEGDDFWLTGVIQPEYQGRGHGRALFQHLTDFVLERADVVRLDVLNSNEKAKSLYQKLGYIATSTEHGITVMEKRR